MPVNRPSGTDVSVRNPRDGIYIKGDADTDESIRLLLDSTATIAHMERRADGVWNDTGLRLSAASIELGRDFIISAVFATFRFPP